MNYAEFQKQVKESKEDICREVYFTNQDNIRIKKEKTAVDRPATPTKVKFEVYGEEMIEKQVKSSGNSGRIYLPPNWVGHTVKIIKVE